MVLQITPTRAGSFFNFQWTHVRTATNTFSFELHMANDDDANPHI